MRISGGEYRGRQITAPKGTDVRPASDKVRQAVFNSLLSRLDLEDIQVLDGFCGTGSYGLEALSRGAGFCTFIDKSRKSIEVCKDNIRALELETSAQVMCADVTRIFPKDPTITPADLVFLDPPYRRNLLLPALQHLRTSPWTHEKTLYVLECEKDLILDFGEPKIYGDVQIVFLGNIND